MPARLKVRKNGQQKTCNLLLQNELKSDVAHFTTHVQTCQQPNLVQDIFNEGGKTRNVACVAWRFCRARRMSGEAARKIQSPRGLSALACLHTFKVTRPSFFGGYHPTLKLSGIPTFTFIVSLTHRMDNI